MITGVTQSANAPGCTVTLPEVGVLTGIDPAIEDVDKISIIAEEERVLLGPPSMTIKEGRCHERCRLSG